jgi:F0F1-type ATP synthase assembly protein I
MKRSEDKILNFKNTKDLAWGMATYTSGSIFGPLVLFGGLGYFIDNYFSTKPAFILVGVLVAFVSTNVLIFKKLMRLSKVLEEEIEEDKKKTIDKK